MTGGDKRIRWFEQMVEIRLFEEKVQELFMDGLIEGTTHLCQGQEAVSVGCGRGSWPQATTSQSPTGATATRLLADWTSKPASLS